MRPIPMRRMVLALVVLVAGLLPLGAGPAFACSCVSAEVSELVRNAEHVVVGRLQGREDGRSDAGPPIYSSQAAYYTVQGEEVLKGAGVERSFEIVSAASGASCGLERMVVGRRYVFLMQRDEIGLTASLCGGTGRATPAYLAEVEAVTGPGTSFGDVLPGTSPGGEGAAQELLGALNGLTLWV